MKAHTQQFLQRRRFYMVLPLLVLPFITMIFWALGGGQATSVQAKEITLSGLNLDLPGAHFKKGEELWDKFSLYEQAKRDSLKYEEARKNDPYYEMKTLRGNSPTDTIPKNKLNSFLGSKDKYKQIEKNEAMIDKKLQQLQRQLDQPDKVVPAKSRNAESSIDVPKTNMSEDVDRLEKMMEVMANSESDDPEMQQIEGMLDKILDIQHPERVKEKINAQKTERKQKVYAVKPSTKQDNISLLEAPNKTLRQMLLDSLQSWEHISSFETSRNGFFGLDDNEVQETEANAVEAVVHETQTVVVGSTIKMRLLNDLYINGQVIKTGQFIFGTCAINGERLTISINSIRDGKSIYPISMTAFDLDGMEGIYIPGAITRDAAKQATAQSVQDVQLYSMDTSVGAQAATAGIEAAKGLFSKKAKLIKITVKAGYQILLQDTDQSNL